MKKSLISSAVALAALSTFISTTVFANDTATDAAETLQSLPTIYGDIQLVHQNNTVEDGVDTESTHELEDNGSTIGFKHKHALIEGMEGFFKAEFEFEADDEGSSSGLSVLDEAYIGLIGDFGAIQVGTDDTVYEWIDMVDTAEHAGIAGELAALQEGDNLQYESPKFLDSWVVGITVPIDSDTTFGGTLAALYSKDNVNIAVAYALGRKEGVDVVEAGDSFGLAGSIAINDLTLTAQFESSDAVIDPDPEVAHADLTFWALQGTYAMGAHQFKFGYGVTSYDDTIDTEKAGIELQALHSFSPNMYCYLEYYAETTSRDNTADEDDNTLAIGAVYVF